MTFCISRTVASGPMPPRMPSRLMQPAPAAGPGKRLHCARPRRPAAPASLRQQLQYPPRGSAVSGENLREAGGGAWSSGRCGPRRTIARDRVIAEQGRRAARVQKDNPFPLPETALAAIVDQAGGSLAGIDRVQKNAFQFCEYPDCFQRIGLRNAAAGAGPVTLSGQPGQDKIKLLQQQIGMSPGAGQLRADLQHVG